MPLAVAAALDLDTWLVVIAHARQVAAGLPCPDWDELQMRQVAWRSIPLAAITFFLAVRQMFEVPCCQAAASFSVIGAENFGKPSKEHVCDWSKALSWPGPWMNQTKKSGINLDGVLGTQYGYPEMRRFPGSNIIKNSWTLVAEKSLWKSCNCAASNWSVHVGLGDASSLYGRAEDWILPYLGMKLEDGRMGSPGSGNLFALNLMLQERLRADLVDDGEVQTLAKKLLGKIGKGISKQEQKGSWWKGQAVTIVGGMKVSSDWPGTLGMLFDKVRKAVEENKKKRRSKQCEKAFSQYRTVRQTRPGALMELATTLGLLLNAAVPIVKRVVSDRSVTAKPNIVAIAIHVMFDLLLCTSTLVMAAGGLMLQPFVSFTDEVIIFVIQAMKKVLSKLQSASSAVQMHTRVLEFLSSPEWQDNIEQFIKVFDVKVVAGFGFGKVQVLKVLAGASIFWLLSAVLAYQTAPNRLKLSLKSCLFVGPCGPLVLFTKIPAESVMKLSGYVEQQVVVRELLMLLPLVLTWMSMDPNAMRVSLGALLGRLVEPQAFWAFWGVAILLHTISGFAAVAAVCKSHRRAKQALAASTQKPDVERPPHSADEAHIQPAPGAEKRRRTVTGPSGTFLAPPRPDPPTRKSISRSQ